MYADVFYQSVLKEAVNAYAYGCFSYNEAGLPEDFSFLQVNNSFLRLFRRSPEEVIGRQFLQVFSQMQAEQAYLLRLLLRVSKSGRPQRSRLYCHALKRFFFLKASAVQTDHFMVEIIDLSPLSQSNKTHRYLEKRLHHQELLSDISLLAMRDTDETQFLTRSLAMIGERVNCSRVYIFRYDSNTSTVDNAHEWVADGVPTQKSIMQGVRISSFSHWHEALEKGHNLAIDNVTDIPDATIKASLSLHGIRAILAVPIFIDVRYYGFIGFDECLKERHWEQADIDLLTSIAVVFSNYLKQKLTETALHMEREQLLSLFDSIPEPIYVADMETYQILYANKAIQQLYQKPLQDEICYKAFMNYDQPCELCTNNTLKALAYEPFVWERENPILNRTFRLLDRMIKWPDGRDVRFKMAIDITDYKETARELHTEKERLRVTLHSIGDGVISTDQQGIILTMNDVAESLTGQWREEAIGQPLSRLFRIVDEADPLSQADPVKQALQINTSQHIPLHYAMVADRRGRERIMEYSSSPIKDTNGKIQGIVLVFRDKTREKQEEAEAFYLCYHDPLTGLYNRAFFEKELSRLNTERQMPLSIILGDVNGLKISNDVFGHQEGDRLLQAMGKLLKESCRTEDIVARWGGDEFVILLPQTSSKAAAEICNRIKDACPYSLHDRLHIGISLGHATKLNSDENIHDVLKRAEEVMYKRKLLESKDTRNSIVASAKETLFERDIESIERTRRLARLSKRIGLAIRLSEREIDGLLLLAVLHDIGKIAIDDYILKKEGPLSKEEAQRFQQHPEIGYRIAQAVPELAAIADSILSHHECWNGKGYPQGLKGAEIPLLARIIAIIDRYDVLISGPGKDKPLTSQQALRVIASEAGTRFDPLITSIFLTQMGYGS